MVDTNRALSSTRRAAQTLRDMIFRGELAAGSDHLESELADRLGMSRTPVREAAMMLEAQGLVEMRPRKGMRIRPVSVADMAEIYDVLTALESLAAESAAGAGHGPDALAPMTDAVARMDRALAEDDREGWARADEAFHTALVRLGGNTRVMEIVAIMSDQVRRARATTLYMRPSPAQSNLDHKAVLEAIAAGRPEDARRLHHAHRSATKWDLIDLLERHRLLHL